MRRLTCINIIIVNINNIIHINIHIHSIYGCSGSVVWFAVYFAVCPALCLHVL